MSNFRHSNLFLNRGISMRIVQTAYLPSGAVLGKAIMDMKGRTLLNKGVQITDWHVKRLQKYNIPYVYIDDLESSHIVPEEIIPDKLHFWLQGNTDCLKQM